MAFAGLRRQEILFRRRLPDLGREAVPHGVLGDAVRLGEVVEGLVSEDGTRAAMAKQARARGKPEAAKEIVSNLLTLVG